MRLKIFFFLVVFCLLPALASAEPVALNDVINTLETPFKTTNQGKSGQTVSWIHDFQAEFLQESQIAALDRVQRGKGEVSFKFLSRQGDKGSLAMFRWVYREPTVQEIISDGQTLWVYLPENRQVIESDLSQANRQQEENPVTFLSSLGNLSRDFTIHWPTPNVDADGNYILELQPRRKSQLIETLQIVVARDAVRAYQQHHTSSWIFPIVATRVTDPNGNRTSIEFRDIRVNLKLSKQFFTFVPPEGVDVVRPTGEQLAN